MIHDPSNIEVMTCPKCKRTYDAYSDDLGTYFCPKCTKPPVIDFKELEQFIRASFRKNTRDLTPLKDISNN